MINQVYSVTPSLFWWLGLNHAVDTERAASLAGKRTSPSQGAESKFLATAKLDLVPEVGNTSPATTPGRHLFRLHSSGYYGVHEEGFSLWLPFGASVGGLSAPSLWLPFGASVRGCLSAPMAPSCKEHYRQ